MSKPVKRWLLTASATVLAVTMLMAFGADARRPRKPTVRQEIAALKAQIAQLQNQTTYQERLIATGRGGPAPLPGGLCADPCSFDSDGDGTNDCEDPCPCDANPQDGDGDGTPDCVDPCPDDATDACADPCRQDSDEDGTGDCSDPCPYDPTPASDGDADGIFDCVDPCPADKSNACGGICVIDSDGDGLFDCSDPCPFGENDDLRPCVPLPPGLGGDEPGGVSPMTAARP